MQFTGTNLPTNATAVVNFGDGSPLQTMNVTSATFTVTHYYESQDAQGNYSTYINVSNLVDAQSFQVSYNGIPGPVGHDFIESYIFLMLILGYS